MQLGIQDVKERGYEFVCSEYDKLKDDIDRDVNYFNVIRIAKEQMEQEGERQAAQEQKLAEVDEMELPFDFDADFGTVGVNQIVRQMLKEERAKNFAEFNQEFDRIQSETAEKIRGYEEREVVLERQNSELQNKYNYETEKLAIENVQLSANLERVTVERDELKLKNIELQGRMGEVEQNRDNAARIIAERDAEIERLEDQIDEMRRAQILGERQAQRVIDVTESTKSLYEQAKQATAAKRQVMVTAEIGLYREIKDAHGQTEVVHESALQEVEVVTEFPELPAIETINEPSAIGTESDVETETVVFGGIPSIVESDPVEEVREAAFESTETTQETAHSEEVGETWEAWVERTINNLHERLSVFENERNYGSTIAQAPKREAA